MPPVSELLSSPRVVATVHRLEDLQAMASEAITADTCDILEFRLDNLREHLDEAEAAMKNAVLPCLITARHPDEGGAGNLSQDAREYLLRRFLPHATLVDVEVRSLSEMAGVISRAKKSGVEVIASCHDFAGPIAQSKIEAAIKATTEASADVTKIAMFLSSILDLSALLIATENATNNGSRIATMGMGPLGKISRLTLAAAGSCLNYGYLHEPNAPGQWPAAELKRLIAEVLPSA